MTGGRLDRPVFIIGAPRSGSSLLFTVLRASSHLAYWPGEAHEVWEADYHPALRGWDSNALDRRDLTAESAARIRRAFLLAAGSRKRLLEKTPRNALRIPFIDELFPDAHYIFLKRDGRENVNSLVNAWRTPRYRTYQLPEPHAIPGTDPLWWKFVLYPGWKQDARGPLEIVCARQWMTCNEYALRDRATIPSGRWNEISYESLVDGPVESVGAVLEWLGIPYEPRVKAKAEAVSRTPVNIVTPPERGKWKKENPDEIESILGLIAPTMEQLGYEI